MNTLLLLCKLNADTMERMRKLLPDWTIVSESETPIAGEHYRNARIVVGWNSAMEGALDSAVQLRWVQNNSAGVDHMPLGKLKDRGVLLTSAGGIHPTPMAETFFAMLLAFSRNLHLAIRRQTRREWKLTKPDVQLVGSTIGIIGAGTIGTEIARLSRAFGMSTLGVRRSARANEEFDEMHVIEQLDNVLSRCDFVVNVLPYTDETHHLFNAARFASMKPGALFFNFGRGASVDTPALVAALTEGTIAGAGLDVYETEPLPSDHPLWGLDNVIMTPHMGGWTSRFKEQFSELFIANLEHYLAYGRPARNLIDYDRSY
jgi:phosphoglycerate dehydrogenase-like enzyme